MSTRLTKHQREEFIEGVMADVPRLDYSELIRAAITKHFLKALPAAVAKLYGNEATRGWVHSGSMSVRRRFGRDEDNRGQVKSNYVSVHVPFADGTYTPCDAQAEEIAGPIFDEWEADVEKREALELRLRRVAYATTTREQLIEALPDFAKYVPDPLPVAAPNLPALATSVADDFVKAGWPAGKLAA